ncbi:MAG: DUF4397 domain-containing protein [Natrialbaceae archaeon]|nr:DUF4397 domain-containing protein [Natrialbaceae archaeon]
MEQTRRRLLKGALVVGGASTLAGPAMAKGTGTDNQSGHGADNATDGGQESAMVRAAHFAPDAPNVDIYVDDEPVLTEVAFSAVSPYLSLDPGTYAIMITAAGDADTVVFDEEVPVEAGYYTAAAIGLLEPGEQDDRAFTVQVLADGPTADEETA